MRGAKTYGKLYEYAKAAECQSKEVRNLLLNLAVEKHDEVNDVSDYLFPQSILDVCFTPSNVRGIMGCRCPICSPIPIDVLGNEGFLKTILEGDRRLLAILTYMGASFAMRCLVELGFLDGNHDISMTPEQQYQNVKESFSGLLEYRQRRQRISTKEAKEIIFTFWVDFKKTRHIFNPPICKTKALRKNLSIDTNLPFLNHKPMANADTSAVGKIYQFEIHPDFQEGLLSASQVCRPYGRQT